MSYQTFTGETVNEAKRLMRAALGDDAVVLSTRRHSDGQVELRAIRKGTPLDGEGSGGLFGRAPRPKPAPSLGGGEDVTVEATRFGDQREFGSRVEQGARRGAMSSLRGDFSRHLDRSDRYANPARSYLEELIGRQSLSAGLLDRLATTIEKSTGRTDAERLSDALADTLRFAPVAPLPPAPIMLVGQTGAGKTSCAAKLAARAADEGGRIAFMSADIGRAGAIEQMQTYAEALDTRFWAIEDPDHVAEILRHDRPAEPLVLDTPGVSPYANADVAAMRAFRDVLGAEPILVIPASGDLQEHVDWIQAFADVGVRRAIITKFDTSRRIGAAISGCFEAGVALAHFSEAPFIADGLIDADPDYLAHRLLLRQPGRIAGRR
ncbi:flagellar biosynthetic protein FlhF [Parvularcula bermudensis HTCC2503]|uniref:Flagellar biosynthetic protein FlhF n=2 Tax=Parvularcula TaxID=208215 RepID=E0TBF6_PARBH|nr:flagellar biosynthetic protein FlhF [Parvularcula bermudensis HTCC2503]